MMKLLLNLFALLVFVQVNAQKFTPTDEGSKLHFDIKNFGIKTGGDFTGMKGKINFDAKKPSECTFDVTVDTKTIDTDNGRRDKHLVEADYFDAEKYPTIHLVSTKIIAGNDLSTFTFKGKLTIKNITKPVEFKFTAEAKTGGALFVGNFEIDRIDFGVGKGSAVMADKVEIKLSAFAKAD